MQNKIQKNERVGSIPYGYFLGKNGKDLIEHPEQQKAIKLMVRWRKQGDSYRTICEKLQKRPYEPNGRKWYPTILARYRQLNNLNEDFKPVSK